MKGRDIMYGYDNKELLNYFAKELSGYSIYEVQCGDPCGFIGQGISRTVFHYSRYGDIVFKIGIGDDGCDENTFYDEERVYYEATEEGLAHFFAPLECIGQIWLHDDEPDPDDEENGCYWNWYEKEYNRLPDTIRKVNDDRYERCFNVYIQPCVATTASSMNDDFDPKSFKRELKVVNALRGEKGEWGRFEHPMAARSSWMASYILRKYGIKEYSRLVKFLEEQRIIDLHNDNWAVEESGELVIIDYAM